MTISAPLAPIFSACVVNEIASSVELEPVPAKTGSFPFTGITSYYNARIGVEKELIQSRYSKEINFTVGPKGLLLKPGEVIAITYEPFGFESKLFRIENRCQQILTSRVIGFKVDT